ncbi:hypothetical protein CLAIMM_03035, partial [Cladophialophora immunda]
MLERGGGKGWNVAFSARHVNCQRRLGSSGRDTGYQHPSSPSLTTSQKACPFPSFSVRFCLAGYTDHKRDGNTTHPPRQTAHTSHQTPIARPLPLSVTQSPKKKTTTKNWTHPKMETAGLVITNVALTSLLIACLDGCNYVSLGSQGEREFDMAFTKLVLLKGWLGAVGATVHAASQGGENHLPALRAQWDAQKAVVRSSLRSVQGLLHDSAKLRDRYGVEVVGAGGAGSSMLTTTTHHDVEMQAVEPAPAESRHIVKPRVIRGAGKAAATPRPSSSTASGSGSGSGSG